jgi:hypothetical protein
MQQCPADLDENNIAALHLSRKGLTNLLHKERRPEVPSSTLVYGANISGLKDLR